MKIITGCATNQGRYRERNQDSVICLKENFAERELVVACVCDGIGSLKNSEIAATIMTEGIARWFKGIIKCYPKDMEEDDILEDLEMTIEELNEIVHEERVNRYNEMGCTMSLMFIMNNKYYTYQVGDSRIYSFKEKLTQLTTDDVVIKEVNGKVKKLLSNYIGKTFQLRMSKQQGNIEKEELFLVSSDGVYKRMQTEDLKLLKVIQQDSIMERECNNLIETIMDRGEKDNLSCAIISYVCNA